MPLSAGEPHGPASGIAGSVMAPSPDRRSDGAIADTALAQHRRLQFEVARYIEQLLGELETMARAAELPHLFYFLGMTRQEASAQTERSRTAR